MTNFTFTGNASKEQATKIMLWIKKNYDNLTYNQIWESQPKHNAKYADPRRDDKENIFIEAIQERMSKVQAHYLIMDLIGSRSKRVVDKLRRINLA
jgi:hypothetical protein